MLMYTGGQPIKMNAERMLFEAVYEASSLLYKYLLYSLLV